MIATDGDIMRDPKALKEHARKHPACQVCGSTQKIGYRINGGVHHIVYRSRGGTDDPENLITLCTRCHTAVHDGILTAETLRKHK